MVEAGMTNSYQAEDHLVPLKMERIRQLCLVKLNSIIQSFDLNLNVRNNSDSSTVVMMSIVH